LRLALFCVASACAGDESARVDSAGLPGATPIAELPALAGFAKVTPVDEAANAPSLLAFRDTLLAIVDRRDSTALHARIHPTIRFSFGDSEGGPAAFFAHWKRYESMDALWAVLRDVLEHGGRLADGQSFRAPWTFEALPQNLDAFEYLVVRDSGVVAWTSPDSSTKPAGTLSHTVVGAVNPSTGDSTWRPVKLPDGRTVYIASRHVRSPVDYRIGLTRHDGRWMIDFFVAGD
jgi:hypothetical protein